MNDLVTRAFDFFFLAKKKNPAKGSSNRRQKKQKEVETMQEHFNRMRITDDKIQDQEAGAMTQPSQDYSATDWCCSAV